MRIQPVEAPEVVSDGKYGACEEARFFGVPPQRVGPHHGAGLSRIRLAHGGRQAVQGAAPSVVEPVPLAAGAVNVSATFSSATRTAPPVASSVQR